MSGKKLKVKGSGIPAKTPPAFEVRPGTAAACEEVVGDPVAARLFHGLLEVWVETKRKVVRDHGGKALEFLFMSSADLHTLTGLTPSQIKNRAIPKLKALPFIVIATKRLTISSHNQYAIHFDQEEFWAHILFLMNPTKKVETKAHGAIFVTQEVDRAKLPYLFKRLYDAVAGTA